MQDLPGVGDAQFETVRRFIEAFDAHDVTLAAQFFTEDAAIFEVDHDSYGHMAWAGASARGRTDIARWLQQFVSADVRMWPTARHDGPGWMEVEAEWTMLSPSGEVVASQTRGRYTFLGTEIRHLLVISDISA